MKRFWRDLSVSKKLYVVVGVMALLIATELATLSVAMQVLSSVRAFVGGEGLWSKAQKDAMISLQRFARTGDERYYSEYSEYIKVPLGDRQARVELEKPVPDLAVVRDGFARGRIHQDDIPRLIWLVRNFYWVGYIRDALVIWRDGDRMMSDFIEAAENLGRAVRDGDQAGTVSRLMRLNALNSKLTALEDGFSLTLGMGSRWIESILMLALLCAVLTVESTGLLLSISFGRALSRGLRELNQAARRVGEGDFTQKVSISSGDDLGQLAQSLNSMIEALEKNIGRRLRAEAANETKSQFLANMSHEIRTPIGAIVNYAEFLKEPDLSYGERQKFVNIIHKTGLVLTRLVNDILDLSKVEAGHFEVDPIPFSLSTLLTDLNGMFQPRCTEKSIQLKIQKNPDVPDNIVTDPIRLNQILVNLLTNAVKFTEEGGVQLSYYVHRPHLIFEIRDTGIGISQSAGELLFRPFSQVDDSSTRRHSGAGLGLVLSRRLARLLGGDVRLAKSAPGVGSTFQASVEFVPQMEQVKERPARKTDAADHRLAGRRALIVDDSEDNRFLIGRILEKQGMIVDTAINGSQGVTKALHENYDVVIMDIQMPVMDGYTAAKRLRSGGMIRPIVALTAHAMKEDKDRCLQAGCNGYLTKPIQFGALIRTVSEVISGAENESRVA